MIHLPSFTIHDLLPNLHHTYLLLPIGILLGALGRRIVGGVMGDDWHIWKVPHALACVVWGLFTGLAAFLGGAEWWGAIVIGIGAWIGHIALGLWNSAAMGRYGDRNELWTFWGFGRWNRAGDGVPQRKPGFVLSWLGMTAYSLQCALAAILVAACPVTHGIWIWPLIGGLLSGPIYAFTNKVFDLKPIGWPPGFGPPLALGEWLLGGVLGGTFLLAFAT